MITSSKNMPVNKEGEQIILRVRRVLEVFQILPDDALVERRVVSAVLGRSAASTWRDAAQGRLAQPIHIGRSARWRVGDASERGNRVREDRTANHSDLWSNQ